MRTHLFATVISMVAMFVFSALFTGLTYSSMDNYDSDDMVASSLESSKFIDSTSVREPTVPVADAKTTSQSETKEEHSVLSSGSRNFPYYRRNGISDDREKPATKSPFQVVGVGAQSESRSAKVMEGDPQVNVTVWCYDINGEPLYLASVQILDPVWSYPVYSGVTNSSGVCEAINITAGTVDLCVTWGNASAPGQPGYYIYLSSIDATSNIEVSVNAKDLRDGGSLAKITVTLQNSTMLPMTDTRLLAGFNATENRIFPLGIGPITDSGGTVTLYLSNDTWFPEPAYYAFVVYQMMPSNNSLFILTDRLVSSDENVTLTMPGSSEIATINLTFSSPSGDISLMDDIRLFFELFLVPPEIDVDDLALMWLPSKLQGRMLFAMPLSPGSGPLFFPVADDGSTSLSMNASVPSWIAAIYTNTSDVLGGPWVYTPVNVLDSLSPGDVEYVSMGGSYLKLRSVTPLETYLGSAPKLYVNFTDEFFNQLLWIAGDGNTSVPTDMPGILSHLAVYNLTIWYPNGTVWYDGQAMVQDPYGGSSLNGILSAIPTFPDLDTLGTYTYNISIDAGPWPLNPPGTIDEPLEGSFEVLEPQARATLGLHKYYNLETEDDNLPSGSYVLDYMTPLIWVHNEDDETDTVLGDLNFYAEASDIVWVGWGEYADWNSSHVNWTFPPEFVIHEDEGFGPWFTVEQSGSCHLNLTLNRVMNETLFTSDGYQMANFTVSFTDTDFLWSWGNIQAQEHWEVNASFVPGTFWTDAPLEGPPHEDMHWIEFSLRKDGIRAGVNYNFSVIVKVELTGNVAPPILHKPGFFLAYAARQEFMPGGEGYIAEMPPEMLPDYVSVAQASTNTSNIWTLERHDCVSGSLREVSKPVGGRASFSLDENFGVGTDDDILMDGDYQLSLSYGVGIHNEDDETDTVLGDLRFCAEAENITWVNWEEYADWNSSYVNWTFPLEFVAHENEGFGTDFGVERTETAPLNLTIGRWMNETTFSSDGYQLAKFRVRYTNTEFLWSWGNIEAHEHWEVNASIIPGTFQTDAPLEWFEEKEIHSVHFGLRKDLLQPGVNYNFSVIIKVELTAGYTVTYKPHFGIGRGFYHQTGIGPEDSSAEMPPEMLPRNVTVARVETNVTNHWLLERHNHVFADLHEYATIVKQTIIFFNLNPNPAAVGQTVTLKGILVDESSTPLANEKVKLYARPLAGSWRYITSLTTNENGIFTWQAKIPVTGTFIFAVYYPGSEEFESTYNLAILIVQ